MKAVYTISLLMSVGLTVFYLFQNLYVDFMYFFSNVLAPVFAGVAVATAAIALKKYWGKPTDKFSKIWLFLTLGMVCWFLGEAIWMVYALVLNVAVPYPSVADAVWLMGYLPLIFAILMYIRTFRFVVSRSILTAAAGTVLVGSLAILASLATPILASSTQQDTTVAVDIAYPALDIIMFSLSTIGLLIFAKGRMANAWLLMNGAILMNVVGDLLFSYTTLNGTYYNGHHLELFFLWSYILFALAFYVHKKEL
jgi:hypothetical protein